MKAFASKKSKHRKSTGQGLVLCATRWYPEPFPTEISNAPVEFNWTFTSQGCWWSLENTKGRVCFSYLTLISHLKKNKQKKISKSLAADQGCQTFIGWLIGGELCQWCWKENKDRCMCLHHILSMSLVNLPWYVGWMYLIYHSQFWCIWFINLFWLEKYSVSLSLILMLAYLKLKSAYTQA